MACDDLRAPLPVTAILTLIIVSVVSQVDVEPSCDGFGGNRSILVRDFLDPTFLADAPVTYVIMAGDTIRPKMVYRVTVALLEQKWLNEADTDSMEIRASIQRDGIEVAQAMQIASPGSLHNLLMRISSAQEGDYRLRVEGNYKSTAGGTLFVQDTALYFSPKFLSILIQLNSPVYNGGDTVRARIVLLNMDLKPFNEPVDVHVMDPNGFIMRRWLSRQANTGVATVFYHFPPSTLPGLWKIVVDAQGQKEEKTFLVEKHWARRFEVFVRMEPFIAASSEFISGSVAAAFTHDLKVKGLMMITLKCKPRPDPACSPKNSDYTVANATQYFRFYSETEFQFPMEALRACAGSSTTDKFDGIEIEVEAIVEEYFSRMTSQGFCRSRIIVPKLTINFLTENGAIFKPGMPFETHLVLAYHDKEPITPEDIDSWETSLVIDPEPEFIVHLGDGLFHLTWENLPDRESIRIQATYNSKDGTTLRKLLDIKRARDVERNAVEKKYLHLSTSTQVANVNEYVIFHVRNNFLNLEKFHYVIISKSNVIHAASVDVPLGSNVYSFSVAVSSEMTPSFRMLVFAVDVDGFLQADATTVPVNSIQLHRVSFQLNQRKDYSMNTVEAIVYGESGAIFCSSATRETPFQMTAGNELTKASVLETLHATEGFPVTPRVVKRYRSGQPDETTYFPLGNYGLDTARTIKYAGLKLLTNRCAASYEDEQSKRKFELAKRSEFRNPGFCDTGSEIMDSDCPVPGLCRYADDDDDQDIAWFRVKRINRYNDFFNTNDDWGFVDVNISPSGDDMINLAVPKTADTWIFNAFAVSATKGISIIEDFVSYSSVRPFYFNMEAPETVRSGEQFSLIIIAVNNLEIELYSLFTLAKSDDYKFVHVEEGGYIQSYEPRTTSGDHQHLVVIPPSETMEIRIPVVATLHQGDIDITVSATTQIRRDQETITVTVRGEGVAIGDHVSLLLDLTSRANVYEFFDIKIDESPIVPYQQWRRYVFGSTSAYFAISGDVVGPAFPKIPVNSQTLLERPSKTTDHLVYDYAANLWTLKYLRLTNQFDWDTAKQAFEGMNTIYAGILQRYVGWETVENEPQGGLKISALNGPPSVWLTAWAMRHFHEANFPDWQNFVHADPELISTMINFLLGHQDDEFGYFHETDGYLDHPLVSRMARQNVGLSDGTRRNVSIPLTAHVLIAMHHAMESVKSGFLRGKTATARVKAVGFLEHVLPSLRCPSCSFDYDTKRIKDRSKALEPNTYALAITAYALTLLRSSEAETAYKYLDEAKRENRNGVYWSTGEITANQVKSEFNRPFIQAKDVQLWDSLSVEATSYALLVYIQREGVNFVQSRIVTWLNSMRLRTGAFVAIVDSIAAMEALTEYSFRARLRGITDMTVSVEATGTAGWRKEIRITNESIATLHRFDLENVWGHLNIIGRGRGQAIIQLDHVYGVDYEPIKEAPPVQVFDLEVKENYRQFRNISIIDVQLCPRYNPPASLAYENQDFSGAVTIEVENPSGYLITQREAVLDILRQRHKPRNLVDVKAESGIVHWYFNKITRDQECFSYTIRRWYPVANMTKTRSARIYATHEPEKFYVAMFYPAPLYALDICAVCGSYQCPYCPFYSYSPPLAASLVLLVVSSAVSFWWYLITPQF